MYNYLSNVYWLNSLRNATLADNKFYQSIAASSVDLNYPDFLTSNDKEQLDGFIRRHGDVVIKFLSQDMYEVDGEMKGIYVNKIKEKDINAFENIGENPITLQRYIDKKFEVRYTFVGGEHFVCRIDSQLSRRASIDWRRYDLKNTPHTIIDPSEEIKQKVCALMGYLSLDYGALDFIVDKFDNWWFLEVNSTGQWLWIEDLCGLNISDAIAMRLVYGGRDSLRSGR
ncbi:glutathione synthase/RimK-type ligase-like ATP-grasp enzyme [Rhizobium sp. BK602]|nr:hypothetical protein [Rhizobium sp. BK602]MBB3609146.1 glutathione synthase/RimK-type ligase-like ATP-grasp enzyme [Rhizobium sp. BK602]